MSVTLLACTACGHVCFPARQLCHRCGSADWTGVPAACGVVEEATAVLYQTDAQSAAGPCCLASVRTAGVVLLVRLDQPAKPGQAVTLRMDGGAVLGNVHDQKPSPPGRGQGEGRPPAFPEDPHPDPLPKREGK